jgi:hypothetical protein
LTLVIIIWTGFRSRTTLRSLFTILKPKMRYRTPRTVYKEFRADSEDVLKNRYATQHRSHREQMDHKNEEITKSKMAEHSYDEDHRT